MNEAYAIANIQVPISLDTEEIVYLLADNGDIVQGHVVSVKVSNDFLDTTYRVFTGENYKEGIRLYASREKAEESSYKLSGDVTLPNTDVEFFSQLVPFHTNGCLTTFNWLGHLQIGSIKGVEIRIYALNNRLDGFPTYATEITYTIGLPGNAKATVKANDIINANWV